MKYLPLTRKKILKIFLYIILIVFIALSIVLFYVYKNQEEIIQSQLTKLNAEHKGLIKIRKSEISLFKNFPYTSIKINDFEIYEDKVDSKEAIMHVKYAYIGFDLWDIINQKFDIKSVLVEDGFLNFILHKDGSNNLENALKTTEVSSENEDALNIHLKKIKLKNLDVHKFDESSLTDIETYIYWANGGFKTQNRTVKAHIDTEFKLNIIKDSDTTYVNNKHFKFDTDLNYNEKSGLLDIEPTNVVMEHADFELQGTLATKNDMDLDLSVKGTKSNFDMFIAFAPHDLIPVLESYNNAGDIYFNANIKGPLTADKMPFIESSFGTDKAYLENKQKKRRISNLGFKGHFTNGSDRTIESMKLSLTNMSAKLERGKFLGSIEVNNFEHPEIKAQLDVDFNINFVTEFFNINDIQDTAGNISLKMNFHDIIDLNNPELALNNLNRAYYSELNVSDLSILSDDFPAPLKKLNAHLVMEGKETVIENFEMSLGDTDVSIKGFLTNLPSIIHHTKDSITAHLDISSDLINVAELTRFSIKDSIGIDEQITNLKTGLSFKALAKDFTESKYLPKGELFLNSLHAKLKHYPHEFHDFFADILIDDKDLEVVGFTGSIDDSDFKINGYAHDYGFWLKEQLEGDVNLDLTLTSDLLKIEDLFTYKGENYVPEEYRHEMFKGLELDFNSKMHYKNSALSTIGIDIKRLQAKMLLHPNVFKDFKGHFQYENNHLAINNFKGNIGSTDFDVDLDYYLGKNEDLKTRKNSLKLKSNFIDFDALFKFNPKPIKTVVVKNELEDVKAHTETFNIYELPFTDMSFNVDVKRLKYHRIDLKNIEGQLRTTKNHYIHVDTLKLNSAGGSFNLSGYFNGSDPKHIYFKPSLTMENVDIDKIVFKFENFGQDHLVSENLHGKLTSKITGNIRVYPDMVPDLDQSEIHMNVKILEGRLENYEPMTMFSDYIGNKNLKKIKFDTLQNSIDINKGKINIPKMTIESTLGHMEISGTHDSNHNIEYYISVPWKTVKKASLYKVFGNKKKTDSIYEEEDIIKVDKTKRTRYLNLKIVGDIDDYDISLGKKKKKKKQ